MQSEKGVVGTALEMGMSAASEIAVMQMGVEAKRRGMRERMERAKQEVGDAEEKGRREEERAGQAV